MRSIDSRDKKVLYLHVSNSTGRYIIRASPYDTTLLLLCMWYLTDVAPTWNLILTTFALVYLSLLHANRVVRAEVFAG